MITAIRGNNVSTMTSLNLFSLINFALYLKPLYSNTRPHAELSSAVGHALADELVKNVVKIRSCDEFMSLVGTTRLY